MDEVALGTPMESVDAPNEANMTAPWLARPIPGFMYAHMAASGATRSAKPQTV